MKIVHNVQNAVENHEKIQITKKGQNTILMHEHNNNQKWFPGKSNKNTILKNDA